MTVGIVMERSPSEGSGQAVATQQPGRPQAWIAMSLSAEWLTARACGLAMTNVGVLNTGEINTGGLCLEPCLRA